MSDFLPWLRLLKSRAGRKAFEFIHGMRLPVDRGVCCIPHAHEAVEIVYHPRGRGVTRLPNGQQLSFEEGDAVVYAPGEVHDQVMETVGEDHCIQIAIPAGKERPRRGFRVRVMDDVLAGEIAALARGEVGLAPADRAILGFRATAVLLRLIRLAEIEATEEVQDSPEVRNDPERYVARAERFIGERFGGIGSLREVAHHVGISDGHLRHAFRLRRGRSPVRHLNEVRVARARALLVHSRLPLKQVASICGFRDEYYFSTVFRRLAGIPPGVYRKRRSGLG